jgi:hypothetical protein
MLLKIKNRFFIALRKEKKETVSYKKNLDFPTLALSRSGYKGVISAQSKLKNMDRSTPTTYSKELLSIYFMEDTLSSKSRNRQHVLDHCPHVTEASD